MVQQSRSRLHSLLRLYGVPPFAASAFVFTFFMAVFTALQPSVLGGSTISITVFGTEPRVLDVSSTNKDGIYSVGDIVYITVQFSTTTTVDITGGVPSIDLNSGGVGHYIDGTGTDTLIFKYIVEASHNSTDLGYNSTTSLVLNGGTIRNSGDDAVITLPAPKASGSLSANKNIQIINGGGIVSRLFRQRLLARRDHGEEDEEAAIPLEVIEEKNQNAVQSFCSEKPESTKNDKWFSKSLRELTCAGYIEEDEDTFRPSRAASRKEIAAILVRGSSVDIPTVEESSFIDVDPEDEYASEIHVAATMGWILGDDNCFGKRGCTYRPDSTVTRAELAVILIRFTQLEMQSGELNFVDVEDFAWYYDTVFTVSEACLLKGDDNRQTFRPADNVNKAEMLVALYRALLLWSGVDLCAYEDMQYGEGDGIEEEIDKAMKEAASEDPRLDKESLNLAACSVCSYCGQGLFNFCDIGECTYLGQCVPVSKGILVECLPDPFECKQD